MDSPASTSTAAAAGLSGSVSGSVPPSTAPAPRTKSKVYGSQLAKEGDVQKYRAKYKDLKIKVKEIEKDNDKIILKIMKAKRAIQRVRMERAIIYERLALNPLPPPTSTSSAPSPPSLESFLVLSTSTSAPIPAPVPATSAPAPTPVSAIGLPPPAPLVALAPVPMEVSPPTNGAGGEGASVGLVDAGPPFPTPTV
ncbi:hypothetical protein BDY24DRAFT_390328 [Mrakia frigida]|uniref:uncharacterized protein n=1 Tax=Mrakia frigida TaxID=29902 RepID=UPI003FCC23BF